MDFKKLLKAYEKPSVYEPGDAVMWTDPYISKQLLEIHLNPDIDAATRKPQSIDKILEFIENHCEDPGMQILDLGCGPGIYTEKIALKGHHVTGIDFSENSINYAHKTAHLNKSNAKYICQNYLALNYQEKFDLIMMIYTDFGVLVPDDRKRLLQNVFQALKPGGIFIFDVLNDKNLDAKFPEQQSWNVSNGGFWRERPYLELVNGFRYNKENVYLKQHTIIDQTGSCTKYRFWTHYFKTSTLVPMLADHGFKNIELYNNVLPESDLWNGENITFCKMNKSE